MNTMKQWPVGRQPVRRRCGYPGRRPVIRLVQGLCLLGWMLLGISCATTRQTKRLPSLTEMPSLESASLTCTARSVFTIMQNGGKPVTVSGSFRMAQNEVIQLLFTPIMGMEMGRIELYPAEARMIDRINRRYAIVSYEELQVLFGVGYDFMTFQQQVLDNLRPSRNDLQSQAPVTLSYETRHTVVQLTLSNFNARSDWEHASNLSERYQRVDAQEFINMLMVR